MEFTSPSSTNMTSATLSTPFRLVPGPDWPMADWPGLELWASEWMLAVAPALGVAVATTAAAVGSV